MIDVRSTTFEAAGDGFCKHCGSTRFVHVHREGDGFFCPAPTPKPYVRGEKLNLQNAPSSMEERMKRGRWGQ